MRAAEFEYGKEEGLAEGIKRGREEGTKEGIEQGNRQSLLILLSELGEIPENIRNRVLQEKNADILHKWMKEAARAENLEEFAKAAGPFV